MAQAQERMFKAGGANISSGFCLFIVEFFILWKVFPACAWTSSVTSSINNFRNSRDCITRGPFASLSLSSVDDNDEYWGPPSDDEPSLSIGAVANDFKLDPHSDHAHDIILKRLKLSETQHDQLSRFSSLVVEWNEKINLISRKDCTVEVVFGRHVLPCLAPVGLLPDLTLQDGDRVVDVGTGGGFPGMPLAIAYPNVQFLLIDSVGKKLKAVDDMIESLGLTNVKTLHSRAEEVVAPDHTASFHWCVGRSVASLPKYCSWVEHLLRPSGKLLYMVGGDVPESTLAEKEFDIHELVSGERVSETPVESLISDKRLLIFPQREVGTIAKSFEGHKSVKQLRAAARTKPTGGSNTTNINKIVRKKKTKGAWDKNDRGNKKRVYEDFQRYQSGEAKD